MLALFPFESEIYQQQGIPVHCVGHSLADRIEPGQDQALVRRRARGALQLPEGAPVICLMPGSRKDEVQRLAPVFIAAAELDPIRDDSLTYAERLKSVGHPHELEVYAGVLHAYFGYTGVVDEARRCVEDLGVFLGKHLGEG